MRHKERLLSLDEPVAFIFAHSALREGWDNPNVFQICTLNQTLSEIKKRQEIGRGLRLCVNQDGERIRDDEVNVLTVVANQSYESYAKQLQEEYVEDGEGEAAPPKPGNARQAFARRNEAVVRRAEFKEFWEKLSRRIGYRITLDSDGLARECVERLAEASYPEPKVVVQKGEYVVRRYIVSLESVRARRARIRVDVETTRGLRSSQTDNFESGDDLAQILNDPRLRGFTLSEISAVPSPLVVFENRETIYQGAPKVYESVEGQHVREQVRAAKPISYPVFDLIGRTVRETGLTRATVNEIFRRLPRQVKEKVFRNPEGFASVFVSTIRNTLADRVANQIEFIVEGDGRVDVQELFPKEMRFAQRELVPAGTRGLYDQVQKDSGVEETFIDRLKSDDKVVLFFKFPPAFKIGLPKLIGSYNPDWGIVRRDDTGKLTLHLVRETKGTEDLRRLQFPQEKRKVVCATKYFASTDIDYRVVSDRTVRWWESWRVESVQAELLGRDWAEEAIPAREPAVVATDARRLLSLVARELARPFITHVPVFSLQAAAGKFGEGEQVQEEGWVEAPGRRLREGMFVAQAVGGSMEPKIPDGAWCLFSSPVMGSRQGRIVLVQHRDIHDPETGGSYTVKRYRSEKLASGEGDWQHSLIRLEPLNKEFQPILLRDVPEGDVQVIAEFIEVLSTSEV